MKKLQLAVVLIFTALIMSSCYEDDLYPAANFSSTGFVPGFKWVLDATNSVSIQGKTLEYRWDYNEDQTQFDTPWLNDPIITIIGESKSNYVKVVTLEVKDENGHICKISKEIFKSDFLYYFRHDTIYTNQSEIPYKTYRWITDLRSQGGDWTVKNVYLKSSEGIVNLSDSLPKGSYLNWEAAKTAKIANTNFILPEKENWEGLIKLHFGYNLAGYNLQVDNVYGMGLGVDGYFFNNQLYDNSENGYYWTATEVNNDNAWALKIGKNSDIAVFVSLPKTYQCKVRFIYPIPNN